MTKSSLIQLHATPRELWEFCQGVQKEFRLCATVITRSQDTVDVMPPSVLKNSSEDDLLLIEGVCMTISKAMPPRRASIYGFFSTNSECLCIQFGQMTKDTLGEAAFEAKSETPATEAVWKKIAKHLRKATKCGAWVIGPTPGAKAFERTHRYTDGAAELFRRGFQIKPIAGGALFELP